jgi:hypothetical protein
MKFIVAAAAGLAFATPAAAAVDISGSVTSIAFHSADPGLVINASPLAFAPISLTSINEFADRAVLTIGTPEGSVNTDFLSLFGEDTVPYPISVSFSFLSPTGTTGSAVGGSTYGFILPFTSCGVIAGGCGAVDWGAPTEFSFGNTGKFSVELFDAVFGTPGTATVNARFTLLANDTPAVPEPATWAMLLLGFGLAGAAMRHRPRTTVSYKLA